MSSISLRLDLSSRGKIGPGKVELLERIASHGSISAGAREMNMSYKRAWLLIEDLNQLFGKPVVAARKGGPRGGGAELTAIGLSIVAHYRAIERSAEAAAAPHLAALREEMADD